MLVWLGVFLFIHSYAAIVDMYESYKARGNKHIAESRIKELLALPEYPHN